MQHRPGGHLCGETDEQEHTAYQSRVEGVAAQSAKGELAHSDGYQSTQDDNPHRQGAGQIEAQQDTCKQRTAVACPMGLEPYLLSTLSAQSRWEDAEKNEVTSCIECGSCQFTCPSHRPLLDMIRVGKSTVMGIIKSRAAKK